VAAGGPRQLQSPDGIAEAIRSNARGVASIAARRLRSHHLVGPRFKSPVDAVRAFAAVQAQDFPAATWAVGQRTQGATAESIGQLYDEGAILRTHVMRPTWHFVVPEDIRWLVQLTSRRVRDGLAGRRRQLEIDDRVVDRANATFEKALSGGRALTREELGRSLVNAGVSPAGQRLPHLLGHAELDAVIVSGPRRGRQHTWTLLEERVPKARVMDRSAALGELAFRFFSSHGPAQLRDLVWWSGLTTADIRAGIAAAGPRLAHETIDGVDHWSDPATRRTAPPRTPSVHLLPNFDEYTVAYRDRSALVDPGRPFDASIFSFGSVLANVVIVDGVVRGTWRRSLRGEVVHVEITLLERLGRAESAALDRAADELGAFLERDVTVATAVRPGS
jgi:hypothetical protein